MSIHLSEGTLNTPALPRFQPPADESIYPEPRSFDTDDIRNLCKHLGASAQELDDLDVMLQDVIDGVRETERFDGMRRQAAAVARALALAANPVGGAA